MLQPHSLGSQELPELIVTAGTHHYLGAEEQESLQGSRLVLAGTWGQMAFAVIDEVITKMHLSRGRSGRLEKARLEKYRALGRHFAREALALVRPREASDTHPAPDHPDSGFSLLSCLLATLSP